MTKKEIPLALVIILGLAAIVAIARWGDAEGNEVQSQFDEEQLYVSGPAAKRITLAFNGLASDWYWIRSLQYVGRKMIHYEDTHEGRFDLNNLASLNLGLLPSLLRLSTELDPQFMAVYEYGAVILPELNDHDAISLLNAGIAANPNAWQLYQHLGYIYWQRHDYEKAAELYDAGGKLEGAPSWMLAMSARMKAEGGSRNAAREMYQHLGEASDDENVRRMVAKQIRRLDSLDERDLIRRVLSDYAARTGHCVASWREISATLRAARLRVDASGAPLDPGNSPYALIKDGCDVDLDPKSQVMPR
jgi:tetratricopeptide (TPR) repeat protein